MIVLQFTCNRCGGHEYLVSHGWVSSPPGFVHYVECTGCHNEEELPKGDGQDETKTMDS